MKMATIQKNNNNLQNAQDFIRIQDLLYLCLAKWHWFVLSLAVCLGVAVVYLLKTPPVFDTWNGDDISSVLKEIGL